MYSDLLNSKTVPGFASLVTHFLEIAAIPIQNDLFLVFLGLLPLHPEKLTVWRPFHAGPRSIFFLKIKLVTTLLSVKFDIRRTMLNEFFFSKN